MKLKTGIIGCGKVGDFHAKAYAQLENSEFTAVCDANLERAKAFAARYNVHAYSDIAEMIQKEHLNVVSVCTPHPIHCDPRCDRSGERLQRPHREASGFQPR